MGNIPNWENKDWQRRDEAENNLMNWWPLVRLKPSSRHMSTSNGSCSILHPAPKKTELSFPDSRGAGHNLPTEDWPQSPEPPPLTHKLKYSSPNRSKKKRKKEPHKKAYLSENGGLGKKKSGEWAKKAENDKTEKATGQGRRSREQI